MKNVKRIASLVLALMLVLALSTVAFAAGEGSITINNTVTGKNYELFKIFDVTNSDGNIAYTIDADWKAFFEGDGSEYIVATQTGSLKTVDVDGTTKYINITNGNVATFSQDALKYIAANGTADASVTATGTSTTVSGLDLGYYLVYPVGASDVKDTYSCIASLDTANTSATVDVKAQYPVIDKVADDTSVEVGQIVGFTLTTEVPDTTGFINYKFVISDTMTDGLTFNGVEYITVYVDGTEIDSNYTATKDGNGFDLDIDVMKLQASAGKEIKVEYTATVNENAVAQIEVNDAYLSYSNDPSYDGNGDPNTPPPTETTPHINEEVYTAMLIIDKHEQGNTDKKLSGAQFVLKNENDMYYVYDEENDVVSWISNIDEATVKTTDENGYADFIGLEDGTYYLVEKEAPAGYNKLTSPVAVTINGANATLADLSTLTVTSQIANGSDTLLPSTGSFGTTVLYILGGALILAAVILVVTKKRLNKEA